jgi:hypothetical protein
MSVAATLAQARHSAVSTAWKTFFHGVRLPDLGGNCVGTIPPLRSGSLPWQGLTSPRVCSPAFRRHVPIVPPEGGTTNRSFRRRGNALIHSATKQGDSRQRKRSQRGKTTHRIRHVPFDVAPPNSAKAISAKSTKTPSRSGSLGVEKSQKTVCCRYARSGSALGCFHGVENFFP